jgi:hypothetical protein
LSMFYFPDISPHALSSRAVYCYIVPAQAYATVPESETIARLYCD